VGAETTVSVVIPTYHRPDYLQRAVRSVLAQSLPGDTDLEVVIAISDANAPADRRAADALALEDHRVRVVVASRTGPSAARNTGMAAAKGELLVLLDDDCEAQAGWLVAGIQRLDEVELVQGRTLPAEPITHPFDRSIWVVGLSGLWESCNLFLRRSVIDRHGGFDEDWNPTGKTGEHWGEDTEWGWRVVRGGTTSTFEPAAIVHHAVFRQTFREWFRYETKVRYFPLLVKEIPELRSAYLYDRYFFMKRHRTLTAGVALLATAAAADLLGYRRTARQVALLAAVPMSSAHARRVFYWAEQEWVHYGALAYGSVRYRRVVL